MTLTFPKWGLGESSETPKNSKLDRGGQNTSPWSVLYTVGKVLKRRCWKWPCMSHSDICSTSYVRKKGQSQIDNLIPDHEKSGIDPTLVCAGGVQHTVGKLSRRATSFLETSSQSMVWTRSYELPKSRKFKPGQFRDIFGILPWESREKVPFGCRCDKVMQRILYGGRWWLPPSLGRGEFCESKVARGSS
jgi:hypothetical protein